MKTTRKKLTGEERHIQIIQSAMKIFAQHGFNGTTVKQLARQAGVSEAMLYQHFPSKEALYDAIIEQQVKDIRHLFYPHQVIQDKDDYQLFFTLVHNFLQLLHKNTTFMRLLLFSALEEHQLSRKYFSSVISEFYQFLAEYIQQRIDDGIFRQVNPQQAARHLLSMAVHFLLLKEIFKDPQIQKMNDLKEVTRRIVDMFCYGILCNLHKEKEQ